MKRVLFFIIFLVYFVAYSQDFKDFYVVVRENKSIEPTTKTTLSNGKLSFTFQQVYLQSFFENKDVYKYEKAFPTAKTPLLQRTYLVRVTGTDILNNLKNFPEIELVVDLPKPILLTEPNDYNLTPAISSMSQLDLIRAPFAWELRTGNDYAIVGMTDTPLNSNHEDLVNKIIANYAGISYDYFAHGTMVAGCIAAETNNGIGISAIGYNTKIIASYMTDNQMLVLSQIPNVKVVNGSWMYGCTPNPVSQAVYTEIWNNGVLPVFAAGNGENYCGLDNTAYIYPASYDHVMSVTSVGHLHDYGTPFGGTSDVTIKDLHQHYRASTGQLWSHTHNDKVDICAPGYLVTSTNGVNSYLNWINGTSSAAPIVAGVAALVYSQNPDFTAQQVSDILKETADDIYWIPENQQYIGKLGTGRVNAYRAVLTAKCMMSDPTTHYTDLMIKDSRQDVGLEPNEITPFMWESTDIWVRNQNDGKLVTVHQNPEYNPNHSNFIYVRVTNRNCKTSSGTDRLYVNWAKASTSLNWPENWDGSISINGTTLGGEVGVGIIPSLKPGQETIIEIPWYVPNPDDFVNINAEPWHFCLLARIESNDDPISSPMTQNPNIMVRNNNNLAWKNLSVVNIIPDAAVGGVIGIANPFNESRLFNLELVKENNEGGKAIYNEAEVSFKMDEVLYSAWERGGKEAEKIKTTGDDTKNIVTDNNVLINNILFEPNEIGTLFLSFNFLTKEQTIKDKYIYRVIQRDALTNEIIGGETFEIRKKPREIFVADAGDNKVVDKYESVTLSAETINELAIFNWYDEAGNLIYTGKDLTVSPEVTKKYKLEVISTIDGFKDYDEVEVKVNPYSIQNLTPNPASNAFSVTYKAQGSSSSYLMIIGANNGISNNYILNVNENIKNIDVSNYPSGVYFVSLICDGILIDSKNLIIE